MYLLSCIYETCVLSSLGLLYGAETWTTYKSQEKKAEPISPLMLEALKLLNVTWLDRVTNTQVLERAQSTSIMTILLKRRLRWLGHVHRMDSSRIPKRLLYGELTDAPRRVGRPHLRFKDVCKESLTCCGIGKNSWESLALDRSKWRSTIHDGAKKHEEDLRNEWEEKRRRRKQPQPVNPSDETFSCHFCERQCRSRIGLHSHERACRNRR